MNDPELAGVEGVDQVQTLQAQVKSLQSLFQAGMLALILLSGALNFLLLWQVVSVTRELSSQQAGVTQMLTDYERVTKPMITRFVADLQEYAKTHPAFQEVLSKYLRSSAPGQPAVPGGDAK